MSDILRLPLAEEARTLAGPRPVLDPAMAEVLEHAVAEAEARGRREGELAGRADAQASIERGAAAISAALDAVRAEAASQREAACAASLELVGAVARDVVGRTPPDEATAVLDRVTAAVALLDEDTLEVRLHPDDHELLATATIDRRLELVADPTLSPGDARVAGRWGGAELTRRALLEAALAALDEEGS